jgi:outer membrane protein OmpA-like peptidoglycan-associated protein
MNKKLITIIAVSSAISLGAHAETTVVEHYCGKENVKFVESVKVDAAQRVYVGYGGKSQVVAHQRVATTDSVVENINANVDTAQNCKDFLIRRYKQDPAGRVTFEFDKDDLTKTATFVLDGVGDDILTYNIVGNTDSVGTDAYNLELGGGRAHEVAQYLEKKGLPYGSVRVISLGEMDPIALNTTSEGRALNRRVDITLSK